MRRTQGIERRVRRGGVAVTLEVMAGIIVGIMVIRELLIVMIIHAVERCMLIITVTWIAMTTGVVMKTGQAGAIHVTIDITMVTPQTVQLRDILIRKDVDHPPVENDTTVTGTGQAEKIRRISHLKVIEGGLGQQGGRKEDVIIVAQTAVVPQDIMTIKNHLK